MQNVYRRVKLRAKLRSHFLLLRLLCLCFHHRLFSQYSSKYVYSMSSFFDLRLLSKALRRRLLLLGYCSTSLLFSFSACKRIEADFLGSEGYCKCKTTSMFSVPKYHAGEGEFKWIYKIDKLKCLDDLYASILIIVYNMQVIFIPYSPAGLH